MNTVCTSSRLEWLSVGGGETLGPDGLAGTCADNVLELMNMTNPTLHLWSKSQERKTFNPTQFHLGCSVWWFLSEVFRVRLMIARWVS